jgi:hypothetical protein
VLLLLLLLLSCQLSPPYQAPPLALLPAPSASSRPAGAPAYSSLRC